MSLRTQQNISRDGIENRCDRLRHARMTGMWLEFPGASPAVYRDGRVVLLRNAKVMTAKQEIENGN